MFKIVCLLLVFWTVLGQSCDSTTCVCSNNVCVSCVSSYMMLENSTMCLPCPSECAKCSSSTICTACQLNYYLSNSTCQLCGYYCLTCTSSSHCTSCMVLFYSISDWLLPKFFDLPTMSNHQHTNLRFHRSGPILHFWILAKWQ